MRDRVGGILALISYKPDTWLFRIAPDGSWLQVVFVNGGTQYGRKWRLSSHMTKSEIVQTALKAVLTAEEHEAREHFLYMGRPLFRPHHDVDALYGICEDPGDQRRR